MRVFIFAVMLLGLSACHAHDPSRGSVRVDGVGGVSWGDGGHYSKGCPPGLAKQGRC